MKLLSPILALFFFALFPGSQSCSVTIGSTTFNLCPLTPYYTIDTKIEGSISFAIAGNTVPNCATNANIWSSITHDASSCDDVATLAPSYALQDPADALTGGIIITHPEYRVTAASKGFQLKIKLDCMLHQSDTTGAIFSGAEIFADAVLNLVTYTITGASQYACGPVTTCPRTKLPIPGLRWNADYDLCALNRTILVNVPDLIGGHLSLNLGGHPLLPSCSPIMNQDIIFANYYPKIGNCFPATSSTPPTYSLLTNNPNDGLLIKWDPAWTAFTVSPYVEFKLICDPTQTDVTQINPTLDIKVTMNQIGWFPSMGLLLTGKSSSACPVSP